MRKQKLINVFLLLGLACIGLIAFWPHTAYATNPDLINFQGKVVAGTGATNPGTNVTDGSYTFRFCLYSTATPTTPCSASANNDAIWRESKSLTVTSGVFQTELGDVTTLPDFSSNSSLYLGVNFNGDAAGEMTPRIHLDSVAYAKYSDNSGQLGGLAAANFVQLAQGVQSDSSTTNASIFINKTGTTANIVTLQRGGTTVFVLDTNGALSLTPSGNNVGTVVRQTSGTATSGNIFDIQGANGTSHFIQVAETAANAGSISITSLGSNAVTIDSGSGTVVYGSTTTTIQKSGSAFTIDVSNGASNSTLTIANSGGAGNIQLKLDAGGTFAVDTAVGQSTSCGSGQALTNSTYTGGILTTSGSCSSVGGNPTLKNAYDNGSTNGGTILLTSTGGGIVLQNATSNSLSTLFTVENNAATFNYLTLTLASSVPHLQVFGASSSEYADIYYDAGTHTAFFRASGSNTTQVGSGTGPVNITAGASSAVAITGHANSTFTTDSGYVRLDGPSGVQLGVPSSSSGNLVFNYGSGASTAAITFAGNSNANYVYTIPSTVVSSNQCLQSGTVSGTSVPLTFGSCGSGSGTALSVNGSSVGSTANLVNTTATGTSTGVTYAFGSGNITTVVGNASTSAAGAVTTGSQSFAGDKIFQSTTNSSTAFQVQNATGSPVLLVDTTSTDATGAQLNYITYSGFEAGNPPTGWTATNPTGGTTTLTQNSNKQHTFNGLFSASVAIGINSSGGGGMHTGSFTSAPPGSTNYIVSFYAKISTGTIASNAFTVTTTGGAGSCSPASGITINPSGFQRLYCQLNAGAGSITDFKISDNVTTSHTLYIDGVQMQPTAYNGVTLTTPSAYQFGEVQLRGVITNPLIVANNGDSTSAFQIQKSNGAAVITADTLNGQVLLGNASSLTGLLTFNNSSGASTVGITSGNVSTSYTITLPTAVAGGSNYCLVSNTSGVTSWVACGASTNTATVTLSPEYPGAVMTPDSRSANGHTGTMTSDFCSGSSRLNVIPSPNPCAATDEHTYYAWTANATNDYDIFVFWQVPSDFSSFSSITFNGWTTSTSDLAKMTVSKNGTSCGTAGSVATTATWGTANPATGSCTIAAGDKLVFDIDLKVAVSGQYARAGEVSIVYNRN